MSASPADQGRSRQPDPPPPGPIGSDDAHHGEVAGRAQVPRWVVVFAVIGLLVAILVVVMLLAGHGPGRHTDVGLPLRVSATAPAGDGSR